MKHLLAFLTLAFTVCAATTAPTQNVTQVIATKAVNDSLVIPSGKSITIASGATITNNGTATGFDSSTWDTLGGKPATITTLADGFGAVVLGSGIVRWNGTNYVLLSSVIGTTDGGTNINSYTTGDTIYASAANVLSKLAGNTTTTPKVLMSTGTGSAAQAPAWTATTAITSLGTVTTGTWQASIIAPAYLGTGSSITTKYLRGDGTWQTLSTGLTVGTTAIASGTAGRVLYEKSDNTLGEITGATSDGTALTLVAPILGTPASGTLTNCTGLPAAGVVGTAAVLGSANQFVSGQRIGSASGEYAAIGASATRELRISSNAFSIGTTAWLMGVYDSGSLNPASSSLLFLEADTSIRGALNLYSDITWNGANLRIAREGNYHASLREGTNANRWSVANTYTSSANYETGVMDWKTESNVLRIGTEVGASGGTARDVKLIRGGVPKIIIGAITTDSDQPVKLPHYVVADLPDASTCQDAMAIVTDANSPAYGAAVTGGGASRSLVISDGTNWIIH
jgi:hypothetical protein